MEASEHQQPVDREQLMKLIRNFRYDLDPVMQKLEGLRIAVLHQAKKRDLESKFNKKSRIEDQLVKVVDTYLGLTKEYAGSFVQHNGDLYFYNSVFWQRVKKEVMAGYMSDIAVAVGMQYEKALYFENSQKLYKQLLAHSPLPPEDDGETSHINLANGTLAINRRGVRMIPHSPDRFHTYALNFCYDPDATCPVFDRFLNEVLPDKGLQMILAEYLGYVFVPNRQLKLEKMLILLGSGANGKSVFFHVVNALLGRENVSNYSLASLVEGPMSGQYRVGLADKLLNYSSELDTITNQALFKQLISGEPIEAKYLYQNPFIMTHYARLMVNANELPRITEHNDAWYRRLMIIPFDVTIPEGRQDPMLANTIIEEELPGVLNWVIAGIYRLLSYNTFTHSDISEEQLSHYRINSNSVLTFMDETGYQHDPSGRMSASLLFGIYKEFCVTFSYRALGYKNFIKTLEDNEWQSFRTNQGKAFRCRKGPGDSGFNK